MQKYLSVLSQCQLFQRINEDDLLSLLSCLGAVQKTFSKKETILAEGSKAGAFGILLAGSAQIVQIDYLGNRSIMAGVAPADLFGEAFACAEYDVIPVSVVASDACEVLFLDCARVLHGCSSACGFHQQLISNLVRILARKNILFQQRNEIISKRTTRDKLMTYLMQQAKKANSLSFDIPFNRQELADFLQVDRSGLSVQISQLCKEGTLRAQKNHFVLSAHAKERYE